MSTTRNRRPRGRTKIQDAAEVIRWYNDGWTYQEMVDEYRRKYGIEMSVSGFSDFRARMGLKRRLVRSQELIPWRVAEQHRHTYDLSMLRAEARRRAGRKLLNGDDRRLERWLGWMRDNDVVIHYDPDTVDGFFYVPRRPGVDVDIIRKPERVESRAPRI